LGNNRDSRDLRTEKQSASDKAVKKSHNKSIQLKHQLQSRKRLLRNSPMSHWARDSCVIPKINGVQQESKISDAPPKVVNKALTGRIRPEWRNAK